jgi:hypothetical protein
MMWDDVESTKGAYKPSEERRTPGVGLTQLSRGKVPLESWPWSRTGENPPYGILGGQEETGAWMALNGHVAGNRGDSQAST